MNEALPRNFQSVKIVTVLRDQGFGGSSQPVLPPAVTTRLLVLKLSGSLG